MPNQQAWHLELAATGLESGTVVGVAAGVSGFHIFLHFAVPAIVARVFFKDKWLKAWLIGLGLLIHMALDGIDCFV